MRVINGGIELYINLVIHPPPGGLSFVETRALNDKTKHQVYLSSMEWSCADRDLADYFNLFEIILEWELAMQITIQQAQTWNLQ